MPGSGPPATVEGSPWHPQRSARRRHADLRCERLDGHQQSFPCSRLNPSSPATFPWTSRIVWAVCSSFSSRATFASSSCTFALNLRHPAVADPGVDEQLDRAAVLLRRARLAMVGDIVLEKPFPKVAHGRRPGPASRGILAGPRVGDDLGGPHAGIGGGDGSVRPDSHLDDPAAVAGFDNEDLAPGGMDPHTEALEIVVPDHTLAFVGLQGIDGAFDDLRHGDIPCVRNPGTL